MTSPKQFEHPSIDSLYIVCSNVYGDRIQVPRLGYDEAFIDAVEKGYDNCLLHDTGFLVIDKATDKPAFLVTVRLEDDTCIPQEKLDELSSRHGVPIQLLSCDPGTGQPEYQLISARLDRVEQFDKAYALSSDFYLAEDEARTSWTRHTLNATSPKRGQNP